MLGFLEKYGWFIVLGALLAIYIWSKVKPHWHKMQKKWEEQQDAKKFGEYMDSSTCTVTSNWLMCDELGMIILCIDLFKESGRRKRHNKHLTFFTNNINFQLATSPTVS